MYIGQKMMLLKKAHQREQFVNQMQQLLDAGKKENRALTEQEDTQFQSLEKQIASIDSDLEKAGTSLEQLMSDMEERDAKIRAISEYDKNKKINVNTRSSNPLEVRGVTGKERMGEHKSDVTIGDLVYSYVTGKYRNDEVKRALATNTSGIIVPTELFVNFIDLLRDQSFLGGCTVYGMQSKSLVIPRVVGDIMPTFKLENDLAVESEPVFDGITLTGKPLYAMTSISLELIEGSGIDVGGAINQIMMGAMMQAVQSFMLHGGDVNGYAGILNDPDINKVTASTSTIDYQSIGAGIREVKNNHGNPDALIINSNDAMNLQLLTDTMGQFIEPPTFMENINVYEIAGGINQGTALVGNLSNIAWGILSDGGLQLEVDRFGEAFSRGQIKIRARINGDFALTNAKLFSTITATPPA